MRVYVVSRRIVLFIEYVFMRAFQSDWLELLTPRTPHSPNWFPQENYLPTPQWLLLLSPYFELCQADCLGFISSDFVAIEAVGCRSGLG